MDRNEIGWGYGRTSPAVDYGCGFYSHPDHGGDGSEDDRGYGFGLCMSYGSDEDPIGYGGGDILIGGEPRYDD